MSFAKEITRIRKQVIMSQNDFAKAVGVSLPSVCRWELEQYEPSYNAQRKIKAFCDKNDIQYNIQD